MQRDIVIRAAGYRSVRDLRQFPEREAFWCANESVALLPVVNSEGSELPQAVGLCPTMAGFSRCVRIGDTITRFHEQRTE